VDDEERFLLNNLGMTTGTGLGALIAPHLIGPVSSTEGNLILAVFSATFGLMGLATGLLIALYALCKMRGRRIPHVVHHSKGT